MDIDESQKLELLKDILLTDEREYASSISKKIKILEETLNEKEKLSGKVNPIIEDNLIQFTKDIPKKLGPAITETLKEEIKKSKDQVVEALYPIMGKMIKKYIAQEIKAITERINKDVEATFSMKIWERKIKSFFTGASEKELALTEIYEAKVEQIFIIEKLSGILVANYSGKQDTIDKDLFSGMLTAIKSFVEDAIKSDNENLELIEYDSYYIYIQNFQNYYIAMVVSGNFDSNFKNKLQDITFDFLQNLPLTDINQPKQKVKLEKRIKKYFKDVL